MKTIAIIQARMGSKRLPGKSLMFLNNQTLLSQVINSSKASGYIDDIIVATTNLQEDDAIAKACSSLSIDCQRGDSENVLSRYLDIAKKYSNQDHIVRVTADNPLNNSAASEKLFNIHLHSNADYTCIDGLSHTIYEFIKVEALLKLDTIDTLDKADKEHVTKYLREHPEKFNVQKVSPEKFEINTNLDRLLTIDTAEDYNRMSDLNKKINFSSDINFEDIYHFLITHENV